MKPGPVTITIGGNTLKCDTITLSYETQPFDRIEFDHDKLRSAPLSTGTQPQIIQLLGGRPAEIIIDCALTGMIGGASSYVPRPLTPNVYVSDWNNVKQRVNITRYRVSASSPEAASPSASVNAVFTLLNTHKNMLTQFQNRLSVFSGNIAYETLLSAQSDNIQTLYFTTGTTFVAPDHPSVTNVMIVDGSINQEFAIPNGIGGFTVYKTYDLTLEQRTVSSASA